MSKKKTSSKRQDQVGNSPLQKNEKDGLKGGKSAGKTSQDGKRKIFLNALNDFGKMALYGAPVIFVFAGMLVAADALLQGRMMPRTFLGNTALGLTYKGQEAVSRATQDVENYL